MNFVEASDIKQHKSGAADGQTVLVIDDNPVNLRVIADCLSSHGYRVLLARTARAGLMRAEIGSPDLVLLDVLMPELDGFEVHKRLKQRDKTRSLPVIFMTALTDTEHKIRGFDEGAVDYITKPVHHGELVARVELHLRNRRLTTRLEQLVADRTAALARSNEQLRHESACHQATARELEQARRAADAASAAKTMFLANMSHELRTPLNAIVGMTAMLLHSELSPEQQEYVDTIRLSGNLMLGLVNNILDFSKIEAGQVELEEAPLSVRDCIHGALELVGVRAAEKNLTVSVSVAEAVPVAIVGDAMRLQQVIVNLLTNAVKFTDRGEVRLSVTDVSPADRGSELIALQFAVEDTGIGIPPERMAHLFEMFSQVDASTSRKYGGTGLGLAISKTLVEMMGGRLAVDSEIGRGSRFSFALRARPAPAEGAAGATAGHSAARRGRRHATEPGDTGALRILLAEDNPINQRVAMLQLNRLGYSVDAVTNGREVTEAFARQTYDVVLMDVQMPEMDGLEATLWIREQVAPDAQPYIIALTANAMKHDRDACLAAGMNDYLRKPFREQDLRSALAGASRLEDEPGEDSD